VMMPVRMRTGGMIVSRKNLKADIDGVLAEI